MSYTQENQIQDGSLRVQQSWWKRLLMRLFPQQLPLTIDTETAAAVVSSGLRLDDPLMIEVRCTLSVADRLRALVSGRVLVRTNVHTQVEIDRTYTYSQVSILAPGEPDA